MSDPQLQERIASLAKRVGELEQQVAALSENGDSDE